MTYFDDYKKRLEMIGTNQQDAFKSATVMAISDSFTQSPAYTQALVDGILTDVIVQRDQGLSIHSYNKQIIFRPSFTTTRGVTVRYDNQDWLLLEFDGNVLYPRGRLQKCNHSVKWLDGGMVREYPCYASALILDKEMSHMMTLPRDEFLVMVRYDTITSKLVEDNRFIMGSKPYTIKSIDDLSEVMDSAGILRLHVKSDIVRDGDDALNRLADNTKPAPTGGKLW